MRACAVRNPTLTKIKMKAAHAKARVAAVSLNAKLAPGELVLDDRPIDGDQFHLLSLSKIHGPVFKIWWHGKITNCVIGLDRCRRFLQAGDGAVRADTFDLSRLIPHGFLRAMEGEIHQKYRQMYMSAIRNVSPEANEAAFKDSIRKWLATLQKPEGGVSEPEIAKALKGAATEAMLKLVYGVDANSEFGRKLVAAHDTYVPDATPVVVGETEEFHFAALRALVNEHVRALESGGIFTPGVLSGLLEMERPDPTAMGNLIQMVEFGRYDTPGLWRWIVHFLSTQPGLMSEIVQEPDKEARRKLALMALCETLRMEQAEAIGRIVTKSFVFENHAFTKRTRVRLCVWESHRDDRNFPAPDEFRHQRFKSGMPGADRFAPLGMDHHLCLGANWTNVLGAMFIECLAEQFELRLLKSAPTEMGRYHFEPGAGEVTEFRPRLTKATTVET